MKRCSKCGIEKPIEDFHRSRRCKDGRDHHCKACVAARHAEWYVKNRKREMARVADWQKKNLELHAFQVKRWNDNNRHLLDPMLSRANSRRWRLKNRAILAVLMTRRTVVPEWADRAAMHKVYCDARRRSDEEDTRYHVDHIVPLTSPSFQSLGGNTVHRARFIGPLLPVVQGFHCEANLRVIPKSENCSKGNRVWPDMPEYRHPTWKSQCVSIS